MILADVFLVLLAVYFLIGIVFGIYFVSIGAQKIDEGVRGTPWHFKLIIFPGSVVLWAFIIPKIIKEQPE